LNSVDLFIHRYTVPLHVSQIALVIDRLKHVGLHSVIHKQFSIEFWMELFHQYYQKLLLHIGWMIEKKLFRFLQRQGILLFSKTFWLAVRPTQLPIHWVGVGHFPGVQRRGHEPEHSSRSYVMYLSCIWWKELKYPLPLHKSPLLGPILSHMNPANMMKSCLFNVSVNINLLCDLVPSCCIIPADLENILYALIFYFLHVTFPAYFILKALDRRQEGIRIWAALPKHNASYCVSLWHGPCVSACGRVLTCIHFCAVHI
jgi:hypothetical protein